MQATQSPSTALHAAVLASLSATGCAVGCAGVVWWLYNMARPHIVDVAFCASTAALLGFLAWWSGTAVAPCLAAARGRLPAAARDQQVAHRSGRHAAREESQPRAAAFFIAASALTGAVASASAADASAGHRRITSQEPESFPAKTGRSHPATFTRPTFVPLDPPPGPSSGPLPTWGSQERPTISPQSEEKGHAPHRLRQPVLEPPTVRNGGLHRVTRGETLWQVATKALPKPARPQVVAQAVKTVVKANPQVAHRPDTIHVGEELAVPELTPQDQHEPIVPIPAREEAP